MRILFLYLLTLLSLAGCDQLGLETPATAAAAKEAEGRAVGSACRHSGRALEDCYTLNPKAHKAAVFSGWRDMDAYMRENNIEVVPSVVPKPEPVVKKKKTAEDPDKKPAEAAPKDAGHSHNEPTLPAPTQGGKIV